MKNSGRAHKQNLLHLLLSGVKCYAGKTLSLHQVLSLAINSLGQPRSFRGKTQIFQVLFSELVNPLHHPDKGVLSKTGKMQIQWGPAEPRCSLLPPAHPKPYRGVPATFLPPLPGQDIASPDSVPMLYVSRGSSAEELQLLKKEKHCCKGFTGQCFGSESVIFSPHGYKSIGYILLSTTGKMLFYEKGEEWSE